MPVDPPRTSPTMRDTEEADPNSVFRERWDAFVTLRMGEDEHLIEYAWRSTEIRDSLASMGHALVLQEPLFIQQFLRGLGPAYDNFRTTFLSTHNLIPSDDPSKPRVTFMQTLDAAWDAVEQLRQPQDSSDGSVTNAIDCLVDRNPNYMFPGYGTQQERQQWDWRIENLFRLHSLGPKSEPRRAYYAIHCCDKVPELKWKLEELRRQKEDQIVWEDVKEAVRDYITSLHRREDRGLSRKNPREQSIEFCTHCRKRYHTVDECDELDPELKQQGGRKKRRLSDPYAIVPGFPELIAPPPSDSRQGVALSFIDKWAKEQAELKFNSPNRRFPMPADAWIGRQCRWQLAYLYTGKRSSEFWSSLTFDTICREAPLTND